MVPVIDLGVFLARSVLLSGDAAGECQPAQRRAQPFIPGLFGGYAVMALPGFKRGGHDLALGFGSAGLHQFPAGVPLSGFAFAALSHGSPPAV